MKRILLVSNIFPPDIGGPATFIPALGAALAAKGHTVTVICTSEQSKHSQDSEYPFKLIRMPRFGMLITLKSRHYVVLMREVLKADLILCNGIEHLLSQVARVAKKDYILKVVGDSIWQQERNQGQCLLDIDDFQKESNRTSRFGKNAMRHLNYVQHASQVIVPSNYLKHMVQGWDVSRDRIHVIHNGIHSDAKQEIKARQPKIPLHIVFVGRLTNWKGVDCLLLALQGMEGVRASIIGDGPEFVSLYELSKRLKLDASVSFTGRQSPSEIQEHFQAAHALVLPSLYEGLSHTLLEAGAAGLCCLASNKGGNPELIEHEENGFLFDPWKPEELRQQLMQLRDDDQLRLKMAEKYQQNVQQNFGFESTLKQTEALLLEKG